MTAAMKPLPLTAEMALAAILGPKTETRRPVRLKIGRDNRFDVPGKNYVMNIRDPRAVEYCAPFGLPGTGLWLREPGRVIIAMKKSNMLCVKYLADKQIRHNIECPQRLLTKTLIPDMPSWARRCQGIPNGIFREAARFKAVVLEVRVERLWEITYAGAFAEGIPSTYGEAWMMFGDKALRGREAHIWDNHTSVENYSWLWDRIYGKRPGLAWADNPWVSVTAWDRMEAI